MIEARALTKHNRKEVELDIHGDKDAVFHEAVRIAIAIHKSIARMDPETAAKILRAYHDYDGESVEVNINAL